MRLVGERGQNHRHGSWGDVRHDRGFKEAPKAERDPEKGARVIDEVREKAKAIKKFQKGVISICNWLKTRASTSWNGLIDHKAIQKPGGM